MNIPFSTYPIWERHIDYNFLRKKEKEVRSIIVRYIHKLQSQHPRRKLPLNIRIINISLYIILMIQYIILITNMIDINLTEILITMLLETLLKAILKRLFGNTVRNTCTIRNPSLTHIFLSEPAEPYCNIVYIF